MFKWLKEFFSFKWDKKYTYEIDGLKIMTVEEIIKDNEAFSDMETVVRYLYTKDKERDTVNKIGF